MKKNPLKKNFITLVLRLMFSFFLILLAMKERNLDYQTNHYFYYFAFFFLNLKSSKKKKMKKKKEKKQIQKFTFLTERTFVFWFLVFEFMKNFFTLK